jgi:hypothetical protein
MSLDASASVDDEGGSKRNMIPACRATGERKQEAIWGEGGTCMDYTPRERREEAHCTVGVQTNVVDDDEHSGGDGVVASEDGVRMVLAISPWCVVRTRRGESEERRVRVGR